MLLDSNLYSKVTMYSKTYERIYRLVLILIIGDELATYHTFIKHLLLRDIMSMCQMFGLASDYRPILRYIISRYLCSDSDS